MLRIEDTDRKREVEGAVPALIEALSYFGIEFDEGVKLEGGAVVEKGDYGPYFQSAREGIYRGFAEKLVREGKAYYCFLTEERIEAIRAAQEAAKELPGIYGAYAEWREADPGEVAARLQAGEPYVIRLNGSTSSGHVSTGTITVKDGIRGDITMPENILDIVILKKDGLPTYHFAHVIDDHLMRTTHVIRGEEWLSSLPVHIALFEALGFEPPVYCHTALMMKSDEVTGVKRKLSKRLDPEFALFYYIADGYHPRAVEEYLLSVINSNYEEWRLTNPDSDNSEFAVMTGKMGASGILFDLDKLRNVSRETLIRIPAPELADFLAEWAGRERPDIYSVLFENKDLLAAALDIGRAGEKPRKDLVYAAQMFDYVSYFFDPFFRMEDPLPGNISENEARKILEGYLAGYDHGDDRETWFEKIRTLAVTLGYAAKPKDYKNSPGQYKGHVGDVSMVIRRALTGRLNAPDIYEIQNILGEARIKVRLKSR